MEPLSDRTKMIIMTAAALGLGIGDGPLRPRVSARHSGEKEHCAKCHKKIPPGKVGRKCIDCR